MASEGIRFSISLMTIDRALRDLQITVKKAHRELDRVNQPDKIVARKEYALWFSNHFINDYRDVVFIDESSFNLHISRSQGRSRMGTRVNTQIPTVRGRSISLIYSISSNQMIFSKVINNSTVNADIFTTYLKELCFFLKNNLSREKVCFILDNARIHKRTDIERIAAINGHSYKFLAVSLIC